LRCLDRFLKKYDNINMDIQSASMNMSQARLQEDVAVQVQAMGLNNFREQAAAIDNLVSSAVQALDPNLGQRIDISA
jgi:Asp-tRNA(Asn)/Glu-tRNA(Gln) amidotransferase B subunit